MDSSIFHALPSNLLTGEAPTRMANPFSPQPHPWACVAAEMVKKEVMAYRDKHPQSELYRLGKMFGVLVIKTPMGQIGYLQAFSAQLDGTYLLDGWVEPIYDINRPNGYFKQEEARISHINQLIAESTDPHTAAPLKEERKQRSQALQRWMFSQYRMLNNHGEERDLMEIFQNEKPILTAEEYFNNRRTEASSLPPSGAGECCAPKLLQAAFQQELQPLCMAEWWMGASPKNELRREGFYYPACQGKCRPILQYMLQGIEVEPLQQLSNTTLAATTHILYDDTDIVVVLKPAGLLSTPSKDDGYSLQEYLQTYCDNSQLTLVHRLDQDTSGIVVAAKNSEAFVRLQKQFLRRDIRKRYEAIIVTNGQALPTDGIIQLPLLPNPYDRPRQMVNYEHGKDAETHYHVREQIAADEVLIDLYPHTGRTHQLRVHMAHPDGLNSPIKGDRLYGKVADRLYLHAAEITFTHPTSGKELHFCVPATW